MRIRILAALTAVLMLAACNGQKQNKIAVYVWQNIGAAMDMDTLQSYYHIWKANGVTGVCIESRSLDQVRETAARAHAEGLEYHAWVPSMLRSGLPHEWYAVNRLGQSADTNPSYVTNYRFLDPANPEVQAYLVEQYLEVARIPDVDYVRLDFIRYPDVILASALSELYGVETPGEYAPADYCYCDVCTRTFLEQTGIDITSVSDPSSVPQWAQFRCDQLTLFVDKVARAVHELGKKVSVDVFPGPYSYAEHMVRQQWNQWTVDMFFPMNYNEYYGEKLEWLETMVKEEVQAAGSIPVMSGLRICSDWMHKGENSHPKDFGLVPEELGTAIRSSMGAGAAGVCLLSPARMSTEHWRVLREVLTSLEK